MTSTALDSGNILENKTDIVPPLITVGEKSKKF